MSPQGLFSTKRGARVYAYVPMEGAPGLEAPTAQRTLVLPVRPHRAVSAHKVFAEGNGLFGQAGAFLAAGAWLLLLGFSLRYGFFALRFFRRVPLFGNGFKMFFLHLLHLSFQFSR